MNSVWAYNIYSYIGRPKRPVYDYGVWWRRLLTAGARMFLWMAWKMPRADRGNYLLAAAQLERWRRAGAPIKCWVETSSYALAYNITID